jgi:hypothetical protein
MKPAPAEPSPKGRGQGEVPSVPGMGESYEGAML